MIWQHSVRYFRLSLISPLSLELKPTSLSTKTRYLFLKKKTNTTKQIKNWVALSSYSFSGETVSCRRRSNAHIHVHCSFHAKEKKEEHCMFNRCSDQQRKTFAHGMPHCWAWRHASNNNVIPAFIAILERLLFQVNKNDDWRIIFLSWIEV